MSPRDAALAVEHGADATIVSNHGSAAGYGRHSRDVLPQIAKAINHRISILTDGGIQRGTDVIKVVVY